MKRIANLLLTATVILTSCGKKTSQFDASGSFEADDVIVSAQIPGLLTHFSVQEGSLLKKDSIVGNIDAVGITLQKEQVDASIQALKEKTIDLAPQLSLLQDQLNVQQSQLNTLLREKTRIENLLKADAATGKQLDDINAQIDVVKKQMSVTQQQMKVQASSTGTQNRSILSEAAPLAKRKAQLEDQEKRAFITNPITGTVISKYAEEGEVAATGKALYKVADLSTLILRAYLTSNQLSSIKLNQQVKVFADNGPDTYKEYSGTLYWISDKAEFTPKTIQTKEERANLVYAVKIKVANDGFLKLGMYGEVKLQ